MSSHNVKRNKICKNVIPK